MRSASPESGPSGESSVGLAAWSGRRRSHVNADFVTPKPLEI
jgi:hypothetical protein